MDKIFTKERIVTIAIIVFGMMVQSNYFATKLDLANLKLEMADMHSKLKDYSDERDKEILQNLDAKYDAILKELKNR